jgi:DNA-directed RNA polymerase subunit RPC12/RpoP
MITLAPNTPNGKSYGWCTTKKVWQGENEVSYHEVNICAEYIDRPFLDICETLLHEMVHLRNTQVGLQDCCRSGSYHNTKFKETAERFGLTVEKGKSGWCNTSLAEKNAEWLKAEYPDVIRFALHRPKQPKPKKPKSEKNVYACPTCRAQFSSSRELSAKCNKCNVDFVQKAKSAKSLLEVES